MLMPPTQVYPRVCGGTSHSVVSLSSYPGLSPRVRGNLRRDPLVRRPAGSIPACAGEPIVHIGGVGIKGVYPRVCGGTMSRALRAMARRGLSPRVRGNRRCRCSGGVHIGSIPACGGGTARPPDFHRKLVGLSPRVRGNRGLAAPAYLKPRSIPACAGEPAVYRGRKPARQVYPRVCGGTFLATFSVTFVVGLSPRVRGKPGHYRRRPCAAGVYPRVCGGTLGTVPPPCKGNRSIPACAGEPRT